MLLESAAILVDVEGVAAQRVTGRERLLLGVKLVLLAFSIVVFSPTVSDVSEFEFALLQTGLWLSETLSEDAEARGGLAGGADVLLDAPSCAGVSLFCSEVATVLLDKVSVCFMGAEGMAEVMLNGGDSLMQLGVELGRKGEAGELKTSGDGALLMGTGDSLLLIVGNELLDVSGLLEGLISFFTRGVTGSMLKGTGDSLVLMVGTDGSGLPEVFVGKITGVNDVV